MFGSRYSVLRTDRNNAADSFPCFGKRSYRSTQSSKAPKHQSTKDDGALEDAMVLKVIEVLKEQPDISQEMLGERLGTSRRVVQRYINTLKGTGRIERIGGKRFGYWKVN